MIPSSQVDCETRLLALNRSRGLRVGYWLHGVAWLVVLSTLSLRADPMSQAQSGDFTRAEEDARAGKLALAAEEYRKLIQQNPQSAELWSNLGSVQALGGDCLQALRTLDRARSLRPTLFTPWYFSGLCHLQLHQNQQAATELRRAINLNPRDANAWYLLARAAGNLEQLGASFNATVQALSLDPTRPEGYYQAGKTALDLAARCYTRVQAMTGPSPFAARLEGERDVGQGVLELAISSYQKASQLAPRDPDVHFELGSVYLETGKLPEAEAEMRKCLALFPASAVAAQTAWPKLRLATILAQENKTVEARQIFESLNPRQFEARDEFEDALRCALLLKQSTVAAEIVDRVLQRFPGDPAFVELKSHLASISSSPEAADALAPTSNSVGVAVRFATLANLPNGNFVAGVFTSPRDYQRFHDSFLRSDILAVATVISSRVERLPSETVQAFVLGEVLHWLSFGFYERLALRFPESAPAQMLAAENLASAGHAEKAIEIYRALLEKGPASSDVLRALARVYWTQARWDEAIKIFRSLLELDPYDPTTLVNVGRIYAYQQDLENAEQNFRRAAGLDPKMFEAHLGLGEILRRKGSVEAALPELKLASELEPANPRPHYALSQIYRKLNQRQLGEAELRTFERLQAQAASNHSQASDRFVPVD